MTATKVVDRRPPAHLMVPCRREPDPPPPGAGQKADARYEVALIVAGDDCRKTADKLQEHHRASGGEGR